MNQAASGFHNYLVAKLGGWAKAICLGPNIAAYLGYKDINKSFEFTVCHLVLHF